MAENSSESEEVQMDLVGGNEDPSTSDESKKKAPTTSTKGRLARLTNAVDKAAQRCAAAASLSIFVKNLPLKSEKDASMLKRYHQQFKEKLVLAIKGEVEAMFEEESIPKYLAQLDQLNQNSSRNCITWRPTGVPADDVSAHLIQSHRKCVDKLKLTLKEEEKSFEVLKRRVLERRLAIANRMQIVKEHNAILKQLASQCHEIAEDGVGVD